MQARSVCNPEQACIYYCYRIKQGIFWTKKYRIALFLWQPGYLVSRPVAFRPRLTTGLALSAR